MSIYENSFFSVKGQKERIGNTLAVLKIAANPLNKEKIISTTSSKIVNKVLETVANNPYKTAAVAAVGITAVGYTATSSGTLAASTARTSSQAVIDGMSVKKLAIAGAVGFGAATLLGKGEKNTQTATTTPYQTPTQNVTPDQTTNYDNKIDNSIRQRYNIIDSPGASIGATSQNNPLNQSPTQTTPSYQTATQDTRPTQSNTQGGTNWLMIAALVAGIYLIKDTR